MFALKPRMEVLIRILLVAIILVNALAPTTSVSAGSGQGSKGSSEQAVLPAKAAPFVQVTEDADWLCVEDPNGWPGPAGCPSPNLPVSPYTANGTFDGGYPDGFPAVSRAVIDCSPKPGCIAGKVAYFRVSASYSWSSMPVYGSVHHEARFTIVSTGNISSKSSEYVDCGTGTSGSCTLFFEGAITLPNYPWSWDITTYMEFTTSSPTIMPDQIVNYQVYYSLLPNVFSSSILNSGANKSTIPAVVESDNSVSIMRCSTQRTCGDPINTHTGVFSFTLADMSFPTSAGDLVFQRSYSTGALDSTGVLGYGWTHNHDAKLIFPTNPGGMEDYILFQSVLGNKFLFKIETDGSFTQGPGVIATLTKSTSAPITYTLSDSQQAVFQFDEDGRLVLRKDAQGHEFDYEYDTQGKLTEVSADNGARFIQIQ